MGQSGKAIPKWSTLDVVISGRSISACDKSELLMCVSVLNGISSWFGMMTLAMSAVRKNDLRLPRYQIMFDRCLWTRVAIRMVAVPFEWQPILRNGGYHTFPS